jgi:glutaminyl-tRNA synthetase
VYIERDDFRLDPPPGFHRLAPGREVRLRYAGVIRCDEVIRDRSGEVAELRCRYRSMKPGEEAKGIVHWVSADKSLACEVNLYDRLFTAEKPDEADELQASLNPASHERISGCRIEPSALDASPGARFQFERQGYFALESRDGPGGALVWNRIITLRDSYAGKEEAARTPAASAPAAAAEKKKNPKAQTRPQRRSRAEVREKARSQVPELQARFDRFVGELGLAADDAELLTGDLDLAAFFEASVAAGAPPAAAATWVLNELLGQLRERPLDSLPFAGASFGKLVMLVADGTVSAAGAKEVLADMIETGDEPAAVVGRRGLRQVSDASALEPIVDRVLAENPDPVARYRAGKTGLLGFLVGQVMKASGGAARPETVQALLKQKLG